MILVKIRFLHEMQFVSVITNANTKFQCVFCTMLNKNPHALHADHRGGCMVRKLKQ